MKSTIFRDITPCIPLKVNQRFRGTYRLHLQGETIRRAELCLPPPFTLVSCSAYFSTLDSQRTTRRYIPEDSTPQSNYFTSSKMNTCETWYYVLTDPPSLGVERCNPVTACPEPGVETNVSKSQRHVTIDGQSVLVSSPIWGSWPDTSSGRCLYINCTTQPLIQWALGALSPRGGLISRGVKLTTHLQLVPKSRIRQSIHPLPHTSSWCSG
jgi:hypothetical protein